MTPRASSDSDLVRTRDGGSPEILTSSSRSSAPPSSSASSRCSGSVSVDRGRTASAAERRPPSTPSASSTWATRTDRRRAVAQEIDGRLGELAVDRPGNDEDFAAEIRRPRGRRERARTSSAPRRRAPRRRARRGSGCAAESAGACGGVPGRYSDEHDALPPDPLLQLAVLGRVGAIGAAPEHGDSRAAGCERGAVRRARRCRARGRSGSRRRSSRRRRPGPPSRGARRRSPAARRRRRGRATARARRLPRWNRSAGGSGSVRSRGHAAASMARNPIRSSRSSAEAVPASTRAASSASGAAGVSRSLSRRSLHQASTGPWSASSSRTSFSPARCRVAIARPTSARARSAERPGTDSGLHEMKDARFAPASRVGRKNRPAHADPGRTGFRAYRKAFSPPTKAVASGAGSLRSPALQECRSQEKCSPISGGSASRPERSAGCSAAGAARGTRLGLGRGPGVGSELATARPPPLQRPTRRPEGASCHRRRAAKPGRLSALTASARTARSNPGLRPKGPVGVPTVDYAARTCRRFDHSPELRPPLRQDQRARSGHLFRALPRLRGRSRRERRPPAWSELGDGTVAPSAMPAAPHSTFGRARAPGTAKSDRIHTFSGGGPDSLPRGLRPTGASTGGNGLGGRTERLPIGNRDWHRDRWPQAATRSAAG